MLEDEFQYFFLARNGSGRTVSLQLSSTHMALDSNNGRVFSMKHLVVEQQHPKNHTDEAVCSA